MSRTVRFSGGVLLVVAAAAQSPVFRRGVSVQIPVTTNAVTMPEADQKDSLVVAVTFPGTAFLEVTAVTLAQLSEKARVELLEHPGKRVYVKGDARTPFPAVAKVLDALRTAGVNAPILLTNQHDSAASSYVPPTGLEVLLPPPTDAVQSMTLRVQTPRSANLLTTPSPSPVVGTLKCDRHSSECPKGQRYTVIPIIRTSGSNAKACAPVFQPAFLALKISR